MVRIAFAWELGANYGHLSRTLPVARALCAEGHTALFAVPDLSIARALLTPRGFGYVTAPSIPRAPPGGQQTRNYGQVLLDHGYADRRSLRAALGGWLALWRNLDADAIVFDHAPTALLAARVLGTPAVLLGTGFTIPPNVEPLPSLHPAASISTEDLLRSDAAVVDAINDVMRDLGGAPLHRLADLFAGVPALITTFAELDHYGPRTDVAYVGPTDGNDEPERPQWMSGRPHVFAYLRPDMRHFEAVLAALKDLPAETICVIPNARAALLHRLRDCPIRIFDKPVNLHSVLRDADAVVSYGGAGIVAQSLAAGIPLLLVPTVFEQHVSAQRAAALGACLIIDQHRSTADIRAELEKLLAGHAYRAAARSFAERYRSFDAEAASRHVADTIVRVARGGRESLPRFPPRRRRVLYAWELGTNGGHLERGLALAERLRAQDIEVIFAVRQLNFAHRLLDPHGFQCVECPSTPAHAPRRAPVNYSDLLLERGFEDALALSARTHAWNELYRWLRPDVALLDYAPTAQLAGYVSGLPTVLIGSGFSIPPDAHPLPSIQPRKHITAQQLLSADRQLLHSINQVLAEFSVPPLQRVSEFLAGSPHFLTTFRELDPYSGRNTGDYVGPISPLNRYPRTKWRTTGPLRVVAYLRPFVKGFESVLQALRSLEAEVKCSFHGAPASLVKAHQGTHIEIHTEPIELASLLTEADVVVGYGSAGLLSQALLAGVPVLMLCDALEQIMNSLRVVEMGAGIAAMEDRTPAALVAALGKLTSDSRYRNSARIFSEKYRAACGQMGHERVIQTLAGLQGARRGYVPTTPPNSGQIHDAGTRSPPRTRRI